MIINDLLINYDFLCKKLHQPVFVPCSLLFVPNYQILYQHKFLKNWQCFTDKMTAGKKLYKKTFIKIDK